MKTLETRAAADVDEVEERIIMRWQVWGRVEERRVARHLMYVMKKCVRQPGQESKESF